MPTPAVAKRYYPKLSEVITIGDLPEFLTFGKDALNAIFDKIHYKNLQYSKSYRGDSAFYRLEIVSNDIGIDLPFGLRFVINPDNANDSSISSFPVTLEYQWEILAYLRAFKNTSFAFTPEAFFKLGLQVFRISEEEALAHIINHFVEPVSEQVTKFEQLVTDINTQYPGANISLPQNPTVETLTSLITQNQAITSNIEGVIFSTFIQNNDDASLKENLQAFYNQLVPEGIEAFIKKLIIPKAKASLHVIAAIEFPNNILQPLNAAGNPVPDAKTRFKFGEATLIVDTEAGIDYQIGLAGSLNFPSRIGKTNLVIDFENAKLDLSKNTNIPEADALGYSSDFTGLYIEHATVALYSFGERNPSESNIELVADNILIGGGGFNGTIGLSSSGKLKRKFGTKFEVELNQFTLTFKQNQVTESSIAGKLTLHGFKKDGEDATIGITAAIRDNGDFHVTAAATGELFKITLPQVFDLHVRSMSVGNIEDRYFVAIAGELDFIADLPGFRNVLPKQIAIEKLIIWDNGRIEFEGGSIVVPKAFKIKVGPAVIEVTNISIGAHKRTLNGTERHYTFFGFDGMLNTGNAGVNASGNGLKYYFTSDGGSFDHYVSIDGIGIDLSIPNKNPAITLKGFLSVAQPTFDESHKYTEYTGSVDFTLPKLKFGGSAGMRLAPSIPAFVVDIGLELATPIPIGSTGLGIYGFRGLFGQHYMPSKSAVTPEANTWYDYYKAPSKITKREGIEIDKFASKPGFSMGAGASIATAFDSGKVFSSKVFLLLGLPDVFLIQGQAAMLRTRIGLDQDVDPPFTAVIIFGDKSVRGNLSVNYRLPESSGDIMTLQGALDFAFFFNNASGWYLNIGKDTPENERIRARILTLFNAYAYLMLSTRGIKAGAGARFDFNKKFGPVGVGLGAYINLGGFINFKPVQIGGFINLGGYAYVRVWRFKLGFSISAGLAVEAPRPFNISGYFELSIKVPFKRIRVRVDLSWRISGDDSPLKVPMPILGLPDSIDHLDSTPGYLPAIAVNALTNQTFQINYVNQMNIDHPPTPYDGRWEFGFFNSTQNEITIPLDSFIDIELLKAVRPNSPTLGGSANQLPDGYVELFPPQKGLGKQVKHQYELSNVEIYIWKDNGNQNGTWESYNIYEAATAIAENSQGTTLSAMKQGYWQFSEPNKFNKIRLLAQHMFSYTAKTITTYSDLDARDFSKKDVFCFDRIMKKNYINWNYEAVDTVYNSANPFSINGYNFKFSGIHGKVKATSAETKALLIEGYNGSIEISLPAALSFVESEFIQNQHHIRIDYIRIKHTPISRVVFENRTYRSFFRKITVKVPVVIKNIIHEEEIVTSHYSSAENPKISYDDADNPITKLRISFSPNVPYSDYDADLVIGGYYNENAANSFPSAESSMQELAKSVLFVTLYNRSFTSNEVLWKNAVNTLGTVAHWDLSGVNDQVGSSDGFTYGNPELQPAYFSESSPASYTASNAFLYEGKTDAVFIPFNPELKIENGSFAFEATVEFEPFSTGSSTLLYKVLENPENGHKKGFSLHLVQSNPGIQGKTYTNASLPSFLVKLVLYDGANKADIYTSDKYTFDCETGTLKEKQYKNILISINRETDKLEIFIDRVLRKSTAIPTQLSVTSNPVLSTKFKQLAYFGEALQERIYDIAPTEEQLFDEVQLLSDGINKLLQPVWRPNSIYAIKVKTNDKISTYRQKDFADHSSTKIFGFKTAGPIGHFHLKNKEYLKLQAADRAEEFKLDSLKYYIDYERSFPDAQSRFDQGKPVFCEDPQIRLFFTQPYINVMFSNWASYKGLPAIESKLEVQLTDTSGNIFNQELVWEQLPEIDITDDNVNSLPPDIRIIYQLNKAAAEGCNPMNTKIKKKLKTGVYQFDTLEPNRLYTALFNSYYKPGIEVQRSEVHKLVFKTSRYFSFEQQVGSFITEVNGQPKYLIYKKAVSFDQTTIDQLLKPLLNTDYADDAASVLNYAVRFDRIVFGGLALRSFEEAESSVIELVINSDPANAESKKILGMIYRNPEPLNDPKLPRNEQNDPQLPPDELKDTVGLKITTGDNTVINPNSFIYIHSRDNSAVFITNAAMEIPLGEIELHFKYKLFNGISFVTEAEFTSPEISISSYL